MKRVYWRPPTVSRAALALIAVVSAFALVAVEALPVQRKQIAHREKIAAAQLALRAFETVKKEKARRGVELDPRTDPTLSGVIGIPLSAVTSNTGYLQAKQTSVNPNWAAVVVHLLRQAGVRRGDYVALGVSGSFPALNIASFAACQTLGINVVSVASASSSEWGANLPDLLWIDMERVFVEERVFGFRSVAASRGGIDDRGYGMSKAGRSLLDEAILRNNLERIEAESLQDSVEHRMRIYEQKAAGHSYAAYINVGGGAASVGTHVGKKAFDAGLNLRPPRQPGLVDSVMLRFSLQGVPVIHLSSITGLAKEHGLPIPPTDRIPRVGEGTVFVREEYSRWLAGTCVVIILATMLLFIRFDVGMRILGGSRRPERAATQPERMV